MLKVRNIRLPKVNPNLSHGSVKNRPRASDFFKGRPVALWGERKKFKKTKL